MHALRSLARRHTWIALLAMLGMALLPTVARALAHAQGSGVQWVEVCTAQGLRMLAVPARATAADPASVPAAGHLEHCGLCTLAQDSPALPAPDAVAGVPRPGQQMLPARWLHVPYSPLAWRSAQPRGPPVPS